MEEQQKNSVRKVNSAAMEGLKLALIGIVFTLLATILNESSISVLIVLLKLGATITFLWWAMKKFSTKNAALKGYTTYGQVFSYGWLTSLFSGIVLACFFFIQYTWIMPETMEEIRQVYISQLSAMRVEGHTIELLENNLMVIMASSALISALIYGLIWSAILASFTKVNPNPMNTNTPETI